MKKLLGFTKGQLVIYQDDIQSFAVETNISHPQGINHLRKQLKELEEEHKELKEEITSF